VSPVPERRVGPAREPRLVGEFLDMFEALRMGPTSFAIFDVFPDEESRQAHLDGEIAKALMGRADDLLATPPQIHQLDVIASKL